MLASILPIAAVPWWGIHLAGLLVVSLGMVGLWLLQRRSGNAAIVDLGWTASLGLLAVASALVFDGLAARRILIGTLVGVWSARLTLHLYVDRVRGGVEEGRYRRLRELWGDRFQPYLLLFFLGQAVLAVLLSLALLPALLDGRSWDLLDTAALVLWAAALTGEALADRQLHRFKAEPANAGKVCDHGLWGWSRHPNYFFEWLLWIAFVLPGLVSPWGGLTLLAPTAMLVFVLKVTGIPPTEAQAVRSRGDAYRAYQRRVSAFFPRPSRKELVS